MDRDDDRRRFPERRPIPPEDRYGDSRGQSYRPNRSPPPNADGFRSGRSPPRNPSSQYGRSPPYRRRSRSPPYRRRDDEKFAGRPRSPPRRDGPRDDPYWRDSGRDYRGGDQRGWRSPPRRNASPPGLKRGRDPSPGISRDRASPPPAKRERLESPRGVRPGYPRSRDPSPRRRDFSPRGAPRDYRPRSRSPRRPPPRVDPRDIDDWRRRSPSSSRPPYAPAENSGRASAATSRRSSPPPPSRYHDDRPYRAGPGGRTPPRPRSPMSRPTAPASERDFPVERPPSSSRADAPPIRPPPTGPGGVRGGPPAGPAQAASGAPRGPAPPRDGPRAEPVRDEYDGPPRSRESGYNSTAPSRGGYTTYYGRDRESPAGPPTGPRVPSSAPSRPGMPPSGSSYSRSQRFGGPASSEPRGDYTNGARSSTNAHLAGLPQIVPGGQKLPDLYDRSRLDRLEEEAEKIRRVINEKQAKKRRGLREWEKLERESEAAGFRADLAEESVRAITGEAEAGAAF